MDDMIKTDSSILCLHSNQLRILKEDEGTQGNSPLLRCCFLFLFVFFRKTWIIRNDMSDKETVSIGSLLRAANVKVFVLNFDIHGSFSVIRKVHDVGLISVNAVQHLF